MRMEYKKKNEIKIQREGLWGSFFHKTKDFKIGNELKWHLFSHPFFILLMQKWRLRKEMDFLKETQSHLINYWHIVTGPRLCLAGLGTYKVSLDTVSAFLGYYTWITMNASLPTACTLNFLWPAAHLLLVSCDLGPFFPRFSQDHFWRGPWGELSTVRSVCVCVCVFTWVSWTSRSPLANSHSLLIPERKSHRMFMTLGSPCLYTLLICGQLFITLLHGHVR